MGYASNNVKTICVTEAHRILPTTCRPPSGVVQGDLSIPYSFPSLSPTYLVHFFLAQLTRNWVKVGSTQLMSNCSI